MAPSDPGPITGVPRSGPSRGSGKADCPTPCDLPHISPRVGAIYREQGQIEDLSVCSVQCAVCRVQGGARNLGDEREARGVWGGLGGRGGGGGDGERDGLVRGWRVEWVSHEGERHLCRACFWGFWKTLEARVSCAVFNHTPNALKKCHSPVNTSSECSVCLQANSVFLSHTRG